MCCFINDQTRKSGVETGHFLGITGAQSGDDDLCIRKYLFFNERGVLLDRNLAARVRVGSRELLNQFLQDFYLHFYFCSVHRAHLLASIVFL